MLDTYSGATRVIFIVGDPIAQVKSPGGVTQMLRDRGADLVVVPAHVAVADLAAWVASAQAMRNCDGIIVSTGSSDPQGFDLVINATPAGMRPGDDLPVLVERLSQACFVGDVVTQPALTPLLQAAQSRGCATLSGIGMFEAVRELMVAFYLGESSASAAPRG